MASSDAGTSSRSEYQVFLSFRGPDTRVGFTDVLFHSLTDAGICVFRDDDELRVGERIHGSLLQAIDSSKIYIPVFSRNYASSRWCLRELAQIVETTFKSEGNKVILPIFFDVEPNDVKLKTPLYRDAILNLERKKKLCNEEVDAWREALMTVDAIKGWEVKKYKGHGELIKLVVEEVVKKLKTKHRSVTEHLVGIDDQVAAVSKLLDVNSNGVRLIKIYGMVPILATSELGTTASTQPIDSHITPGSVVHFTEVSPSSSTLSLATALIPVQSAVVPSTQLSSSHLLAYAEEKNSPQSLLKTRRMLDEASHILGFTSNVASPRQMAIEKVRDKLLRLLDLSSGGFPMLLCNQTAFDQLKFLLDELCSAEPSEILPLELKAKLDDFSKAFVSRIESYRRNYDLIISLTLSDQPYPENNQAINELSHTVKERQTNLHALVEEISGLDEEEVLLKKQKAEIEQKLAFLRDTRKFKHTRRLQLEMDFNKDITILKELKQTEHQRRLAAEAENRCTKNKCITENGQFDHSILSLQSDVKKLLFPKKNSDE